MRYQGSKYRLREVINAFVESNIGKDDYYVEPFMGGCNSLAYVNHHKKIGADYNKHMVSLWNDIKNGKFIPPSELTKEEYYSIKDSYEKNDGIFTDSLIGYVGSSCSYGSGWWNGYASYNEKKKENHIKEAYNGIIRQIKNFSYLDSCGFINCSYDELDIPDRSFVYCDPPYRSTHEYESQFDSDAFWEWCRIKTKNGCKILVSEYDAPSDFVCIWSKEMQDGMKMNNGKKVEKMFIHKSIENAFVNPFLKKAA